MQARVRLFNLRILRFLAMKISMKIRFSLYPAPICCKSIVPIILILLLVNIIWKSSDFGLTTAQVQNFDFSAVDFQNLIKLKS